jgi:hypothetical protein
MRPPTTRARSLHVDDRRSFAPLDLGDDDVHRAAREVPGVRFEELTACRRGYDEESAACRREASAKDTSRARVRGLPRAVRGYVRPQ